MVMEYEKLASWFSCPSAKKISGNFQSPAYWLSELTELKSTIFVAINVIALSQVKLVRRTVKRGAINTAYMKSIHSSKGNP